MKESFKELIKDLKTKDERGKIITLHLYIQDWLDAVLKKYTGAPEIKGRLKFWQKAELVYAVDLIDDITLHNIIKINELRNLFGHVRKPDEHKKLRLISELKAKPNFESKGFTRLEEICIQTMLELYEVYEKLDKPS
jgi:hypothetical protein